MNLKRNAKEFGLSARPAKKNLNSKCRSAVVHQLGGEILANDGTVKIGTELDDSGFKKGLGKLGNVAKTALKGSVAAIGSVATAASGAVVGLLSLESATEEYRIAQGKLNTAFEAAGYSVENAKEVYGDFYAILGDTDTATEASQLLAKLTDSQEDLSTWTRLSAGVYGTFGDSLPIEGLIESANETAKVGQVTGTLADALNWAGISEDEFNEKLAECSNESQRNQLIMDTLSETYDEASDAFYRNNEELVKARENQVILDETLSKLGETISNVKNNLISEFLPGISEVVSAFNDLINGAEGSEEALSNAISGLISSLTEKLPDFLSFGLDIIQAILKGIIQNLPVLLDGAVQIIEEIGSALLELAPMLLEAGIELLKYISDGIVAGIPEFVEKLPEIISGITQFITDNLPALLEIGTQIIVGIIDGIVSAIPILIESLPELITTIVNFVNDNLPEIIGSGIEIITALIYGIISAIPSLATALPDVAKAIFEGFSQLPELLFDIGVNIIQGLIDGAESMIDNVVGAIGNVIDKIFGTAEEKAEVHSPSKRGYELGANIDYGIANGIEGETNSVKSAISKLDIIGEIERSMPSIQRKVEIAASAMSPSFGNPNNLLSQNTNEVARNTMQSNQKQTSQTIVIKFDGELSQLAQVLTPYIDEEHSRLGESLA